jgi:methyltransferase family protein
MEFLKQFRHHIFSIFRLVRRHYRESTALLRSEAVVNHRVDERSRIADMVLPKGGIGAEIGVFTGLFSRALARITEPRMLYLVDGWETIWGERYPNWGPYTAEGRLKTRTAMNAAIRRTAFLQDRVVIVVGNGQEWLASLEDSFLDWVYLDTMHTYEGTLAELSLIAPKLKPGGVILCDDCHPDPAALHHGAFVAITEFCRTTEFEIFHMANLQAALRRTPPESHIRKKQESGQKNLQLGTS